VQIEIEYCVPCGYLPRATDAQTRILEAFGNRVESVTLKTGRKGIFTFRANGETIYAKPEDFSIDAIIARIGDLLPAVDGPLAGEGVVPEGRTLLAGKLA
jgi:selenoprotein W-related protein